MLKIKLLIFLFFLNQFCVFSQENCPAGNELRDVKCSSKIVQKCVPENHTCSRCWTVEFAPCPGRTIGGSWGYSSYDKAVEMAKNASNNWSDGKCTWWDNNVYKIYLDDSKFCNSSSFANDAVKKDAISRANIMIDNILGNLRDEAMRIATKRINFPNIPGGVFDEWQDNIDASKRNIEDMKAHINQINDVSIEDINNIIDDINSEKKIINNNRNNYNSKIKVEEQKIANEKQMQMQKEANEKQQKDLDEYNRKKRVIEEENQANIKRQQDAINRQLAENQAKTDLYVGMINLAGDVTKAIMDANEEKRQREQERQDRIDEEERERFEAEMAERKRRADEEIAINKENERRSNIVYERKSFVESIPKGKMPNSADFISDDIYVYFISIDQITYNKFNVYISSIVSIKKQSDNSWPLKDVVLKKHLISNNTDNIKLIGYFKNRESAEISVINISQKFKQKGADIRALVLKNTSESSTLPKTEIEKNKSKSNFWNE